jgi:hypothetical protein
MADKHTCCGEIWHGFGFNRCGRGAKYAHEGNWYCKTHHPPTAQQKKEAWRTAFGGKLDAERKAREEAAAAKAETERRAALYPELLEVVQKYIAWAEAENDHKETTFWERVEMCREVDALARVAIAKAEGGQK